MPDWKHLSGITGPDFLSKLGWIIEVPAGLFCRLSALPLASTTVFKKLEALGFSNTSFAYKPTDYARTLLGRQVEESRAMVNQLPPEQRDVALPDPYLAWHLAALVAQLCAGDEETHDDFKALQAARLGIMVANWATRQHLHHYRHAFPADGAGSFVEQDLSIFRLLNLTPLPVRAFMAHVRCVNEDACLASLRRAVDAGLALEAEPGLFAAIPSPKSSVTETRMDHTPSHFGPTEPAPCGTDNIDGMPRYAEPYNSPPESK